MDLPPLGDPPAPSEGTAGAGGRETEGQEQQCQEECGAAVVSLPHGKPLCWEGGMEGGG